MARNRSMMAGMTDYTGVSLEDILSHIQDWRDATDKTVANLCELSGLVAANKTRLDFPEELQRYVGHFIDLLSRYKGDLERLLKEMPSKVSPAHVDIVRQIYQSAEYEDHYCVDYKREHIYCALKDESLRHPIIDRIYEETRGMLIDYKDLSNLAPRLATFVGIERISDERKFAELALEEARLSVPEDDRPHPSVGAVIVKGGEVLSKAHRGESLKSHAEYIALERKLSDEAVAGATVYTTLEPCTSRNHPKIPCAQRLIERKIARVFIGILDPNPDIRGLGYQKLRDAGIDVQMFPHDLANKVEELNRAFIHAQREEHERRLKEKGEPRK